jgi:phosphatidylglycerol:prolipoprotein diacylglycerol transferase
MSGPLWYPLGRVWVKSLRPDAWAIGSIPTAQIVSVVLIVIAAAVLAIRHRNRQATSIEQAK